MLICVVVVVVVLLICDFLVPRKRVHLQRSERLQISGQSLPRRSLDSQRVWVALGPKGTLGSFDWDPARDPAQLQLGKR